MLTRRQTLATGAGGLAAALLAPAAHADTVDELIAEFVGDMVPASGGIHLDIPEIAENGSTVPVRVSAAGAEEIMILAPYNPDPGVARFRFGEAAGSHSVSTRIRLAESQEVLAIARLSDGRVVQTSAAVTVTVGGCIG